MGLIFVNGIILINGVYGVNWCKWRKWGNWVIWRYKYTFVKAGIIGAKYYKEM